MAKKEEPPKNDTTFKFRCRATDLEAFRLRSEAEGFGGNIAAWLLWHLRRIVKDAEKKP